jgi:hypothetical protein
MDALFRKNLAIHRLLRRDLAAQFAALTRINVDLISCSTAQIAESRALLRRLPDTAAAKPRN